MINLLLIFGYVHMAIKSNFTHILWGIILAVSPFSESKKVMQSFITVGILFA